MFTLEELSNGAFTRTTKRNLSSDKKFVVKNTRRHFKNFTARREKKKKKNRKKK